MMMLIMVMSGITMLHTKDGPKLRAEMVTFALKVKRL